MYDSLPRPTQSGHFFFGEGAGTAGAIMRIGATRRNVETGKSGKWMASTGDQVLFDADDTLAAYDTPEDALEDIRMAVAQDLRKKRQYGANR